MKRFKEIQGYFLKYLLKGWLIRSLVNTRFRCSNVLIRSHKGWFRLLKAKTYEMKKGGEIYKISVKISVKYEIEKRGWISFSNVTIYRTNFEEFHISFEIRLLWRTRVSFIGINWLKFSERNSQQLCLLIKPTK